MKRMRPVVLSATGLLVLLEVVGAMASQPFGFPYPTLGAVSLIVYASVGLIGALRAGLLSGVLAAGLVGLLDGTLSPLCAWMVGSGPFSITIIEPRVFAYRIAVVTLTALAAGAIGALTGGWIDRRRTLRSGSSVAPR